MARVKRVQTMYRGVYYVQGMSFIKGKLERIYYIRYRKNGKETEEKAGREFEDKMTAARAAELRQQKIKEARASSSRKKIGEENSGRQFQDAMTAVKAREIRFERIEHKRPPQKEMLNHADKKEFQIQSAAALPKGLVNGESTTSIEKLNPALKVPLEKREEDRFEIEKKLLSNGEELNKGEKLTREDTNGLNVMPRSLGEHLYNESQIVTYRRSIEGKAHQKDHPQKPQTGEQLTRQNLEFERLISILSAKFLSLPVELIEQEIEQAQKLVCESLSFHRSLYIEFSKSSQTVFTSHIYRADDVMDRNLEKFRDEALFMITKLQQDKMIIISDPEALSDEFPATVKSFIKKLGTSSCVVFPLKVGEAIIGGISWESLGTKIQWTKHMLERLSLISEMFASALSRKLTEEALRNSIMEIKKLKDQLESDNLYLLDEIKLEYKHYKIVGESDSLRKVLSQIETVAATNSNVLLLGETGTGKEMVARAIHDLSPRKERPMVKVNCSALPATLIESELFGYEKGAFSGADSSKEGRFETASGSTIFLDEIGDLPLELQPKLLRVLQEGEFQKLGSSRTTTVDVRVIAATNQDLERAVKEGKFRSDLYFRLNVYPITVPPLRERPEDIPMLVTAFVQQFCQSMGKTIDTISAKNLEALQRYHWPGNIRELRNLVERAMIISKGKVLQIKPPEPTELEPHKIESMDDMQRMHIQRVLKKTGGRLFGDKGAARLLNMKPETLRSRMRHLGISRTQYLS